MRSDLFNLQYRYRHPGPPPKKQGRYQYNPEAHFPGKNQQEGKVASVPQANPPPEKQSPPVEATNSKRGGSSNNRGKGHGRNDCPGPIRQDKSLMDLLVQGVDIPCMGCCESVVTKDAGYVCQTCNLNVKEHVIKKA